MYCHYRELLSYKAAQLSCQILFALCLNPKVFSSLTFWCAMSSQLGQAEPRLLSDVSTLHCNIDGLSIKTAAKNQHWPRPAYCPDAWPLPSPCLSRAALPWQSVWKGPWINSEQQPSPWQITGYLNIFHFYVNLGDQNKLSTETFLSTNDNPSL